MSPPATADNSPDGGRGAVSALGPIDPSSVLDPHENEEKEKAAPWIVRQLVGSMTGRIMMSSYESLRAAGTGVWGDSSPLSLPCIRFRDIVVHTVIAATGGAAAIASPVMGPASDVAVSSLGDTVLVHFALQAGFDLATKAGDDLLIEYPIESVIPIHSSRLETTHVKVLEITLKFKAAVEDARLGFFRSSVHKDADLFAKVKDYLRVEKGWFNPYLFASARRPIIPRSMKADIIFCHGPFLQGDYRLGETLLNESASIITLCPAPELSSDPEKEKEKETIAETPASPESGESGQPTPSKFSLGSIKSNLKDLQPALTNRFARSKVPAPDDTDPASADSSAPEPDMTARLAKFPTSTTPRRLVIIVVGIKPHRKLWTTSARPEESVIQYILLNGCPSIVVPVKVGAPLVAWDTLTLEQLWEIELPPKSTDESSKPPKSTSGKFEGIVQVLLEFLDLCIDWERVIKVGKEKLTEERKRDEVKAAVTLLVASAVRSRDSKEAKKELDKVRSGIAMWRIP
ncbi:hypothetical protein V5O48_011320 [Marasmius crinis-equi]|uniref:Uncharacterized protein n=1 Tax=Marasmius crinis-equi TaxID=585013 RepID=A0ABR3F5Z5_9AGAR